MKRTAKRRVIVNIERLVLKGVRYEDRHEFAQGTTQAGFSEAGLAQRLSNIGSIPHLHVGSVHVAAEARP
jgi:hypothetical protein